MNYEQHEIAAIFPMMSETELIELAEDIKINGLKTPVLLYENKILDGRNRYKACQIANIEPSYNQYEGSSPVSHVMSLNLHRRQLTAGQRAILAVELLPHIETEAKKRQNTKHISTYPLRGSEPLSKGRSVDIVSKIVGCSDKSVQLVKKIKHESPELYNKVKSGDYTLKDAQRNIKQSNNINYHIKEQTLKDVSNVILSNDDIKLYNNDILDAPIHDNSLDVIITDPPYPREYLDCWTKLAQFASKKLKQNGILIAVSGESYLPEVYQRMTIEGLNYYWTGCIYTPGTSPVLQTKRLKTNWKPFLFYVKCEYKGTFQKTDVYISKYEDTSDGQQYHKWGQSYDIFNSLVQDYTYADSVVCDPFLGGGTTAIACINNKRKFIGVEINTPSFNIAQQRISEEL